ncbi:MAG: hypothetical protein KAW92_04205 [Candidatus Cloacimonetes bacterium]|nr:hypothetical protein [Candidatus Cloacimonadota bacterium]
MRIYLNPYCNYGKGLSKWQKIESELHEYFGEFIVEEILSTEELQDQIEDAKREGENVFIAAGGDGTVNLMLNALMNSSTDKEDFILGAVGLGSSNDFHKPFHSKNFIKGIPIRIDWDNPKLCDIIRVNYNNSQNHSISHYCIINASIGITAQANAVYNSRIPFIEFIQKISIEAAIFASALKTIFTYHNIPCKIVLERSKPRSFRLTNLGVIKNPHFAGGLCYDTHIDPDDGNLGVNLCANMTIPEAIKILINLYKKQFQGRPNTYSWLTNGLSVTAQQPFALELDGEVVQTNDVKFELLPKTVRCCA